MIPILYYYQKRQWALVPLESAPKMLSNDAHLVLLPKKAMPHGAIGKYSKNAVRWYPYYIITKKGNEPWCHWKVLKKCFLMMPILYYYQKRQCAMVPFESTQKMLSNDAHIVLLPKKAMHPGAIQKYSKNAFWWYPYCIVAKNGNYMWLCHRYMWQYSKNAF